MTLPARPLRAYVDTSVFGGVHDVEFETPSRAFMDAVGRGRIIALVGSMTLAELAEAPEQVQAVLADLPQDNVFRCGITAEVEELCDAYLAAGVLGPKWRGDAAHVATATVHDADMVVSWNFRRHCLASRPPSCR